MSLHEFFLVPWLCLPLIGANMLPVVVGRGGRPLDTFWWWPKQYMTGPGKTLRGFTGGSLLAVSLTWGLGHAAAAGFQNQQLMSVWYFGNVRGLRVMLAMAAGALLGDLIESIIKRKRGLARGARWWPWDQLDAVIGGFMAVLIVDHQWFFQNLIPGRGLLVAIWIGIYLAVHPLFSWSAYALKLKANPH